MGFMITVEWYVLLSSSERAVRSCLFAHAEPKSLVVHSVWWGRHHRRLVAVMGGSGGAGHLPSIHPPTTTTNSTHKQRGVVWSHSEALSPSTAVITPLKTHTSTPVLPHIPPPGIAVLPFEISLPVSSFFQLRRVYCSGRWDRMEDVEEEWSEEITTARVQYQLSTGIPSKMGGSLLLPSVFRVSHVSRGHLSVSCGRHEIKLVENMRQNFFPFPSKHSFDNLRVNSC